MRNAINWFELPTQDLDRAVRFYEKSLAVTLKREVFNGTDMAIFPADQQAAGGALIRDAKRAPSGDGALVYLDASGKLDAALDRIPAAGGQVVLPKTDIGPPGFIAIVKDTEGNVIGLHSPR